MPFARDLVSHYAVTINSEFHIDSTEAYLSRPVGPDEIIAVHSKKTFWKEYWPEYDVTNSYLPDCEVR
jgi:hypothetical protein